MPVMWWHYEWHSKLASILQYLVLTTEGGRCVPWTLFFSFFSCGVPWRKRVLLGDEILKARGRRKPRWILTLLFLYPLGCEIFNDPYFGVQYYSTNFARCRNILAKIYFMRSPLHDSFVTLCLLPCMPPCLPQAIWPSGHYCAIIPLLWSLTIWPSGPQVITVSLSPILYCHPLNQFQWPHRSLCMKLIQCLWPS